MKMSTPMTETDVPKRKAVAGETTAPNKLLNGSTSRVAMAPWAYAPNTSEEMVIPTWQAAT